MKTLKFLGVRGSLFASLLASALTLVGCDHKFQAPTPATKSNPVPQKKVEAPKIKLVVTTEVTIPADQGEFYIANTPNEEKDQTQCSLQVVPQTVDRQINKDQELELTPEPVFNGEYKADLQKLKAQGIGLLADGVQIPDSITVSSDLIKWVNENSGENGKMIDYTREVQFDLKSKSGDSFKIMCLSTKESSSAEALAEMLKLIQETGAIQVVSETK